MHSDGFRRHDLEIHRIATKLYAGNHAACSTLDRDRAPECTLRELPGDYIKGY
jgi:hypothetical protein